MSKQEIAVLGGGVAGLATARALEDSGNKVTIFDKQGSASRHYRSVYTIFQGETAHLADYFSPGTLTPLNYFRVVSNEASILLDGPGYCMVDYPKAINDLKNRLLQTKIEELPRKSDTQVRDSQNGAEILIDNQSFEFDAVVDCTGCDAITSSENPIVNFVYGEVFRGNLNESEMLIAFVNEIGCTCWANPSVKPGYVDLVITAWGWKSDTNKFIQEGEERMKVLAKFLQERKMIHLDTKKSELRFVGSIASQVGTKPNTKHIFSAGDAARMAVPKTGDGFRWALLGGEVVAQSIASNGTPLTAYNNFYQHRPKWKDRLLEAATLARLTNPDRFPLGESVVPMREMIAKHPRLKGLVEDFFIKKSLHPHLLLYVLTQPHFRKIFATTIFQELKISLSGVGDVKPRYILPELTR